MTTRDRVVDEVGAMLSDAQHMLQRAGAETGDIARDLRSQVDGSLSAVKSRLHAVEQDALHRAKLTRRAADQFVHDKPWQAVGIAAVLGIVIGLLMNRR